MNRSSTESDSPGYLLAKLQALLDARHQDGYRKGFADGFAQGRKQGVEETERALFGSSHNSFHAENARQRGVRDADYRAHSGTPTVKEAIIRFLKQHPEGVRYKDVRDALGNHASTKIYRLAQDPKSRVVKQGNRFFYKESNGAEIGS